MSSYESVSRKQCNYCECLNNDLQETQHVDAHEVRACLFTGANPPSDVLSVKVLAHSPVQKQVS